MKGSGVIALVLLSSLAFAQNQNKKKPTVSAVFNHARYVWVESMDGDIYNPNLLPADREAITNVQNALRKWGRYVLTADRQDAELVFVVRTGRVAEGRIRGSVSSPGTGPSGYPNTGPQPDPMGTGGMLGGGIGPPDDLLRVVVGNDPERGAQVWLRSEKNGLAGPDVPLLQQLKKAVDHDYPR
jgi:hypothetical protein